MASSRATSDHPCPTCDDTGIIDSSIDLKPCYCPNGRRYDAMFSCSAQASYSRPVLFTQASAHA